MKKYKVMMIASPYTYPIEFIQELGDKSSKIDVQEQIKRNGIKGEIINISEVSK